MNDINNILQTFADMVADAIIAKQQPVATIETRRLSGIQGIMEIAQCSRSQAIKLRESRILDDAITTVSARKFLIDEQKAIECLKKRKGGRVYVDKKR